MVATSFLTPAGAALADEVLRERGTGAARLADTLCALLDELLGAPHAANRCLSVCVHLRGVEVLYVGGGTTRRPGRAGRRAVAPVGPTDLFAVASVTKGIAAAGLLAVVDDADQGDGAVDSSGKPLAWATPAQRVWPSLPFGGTVRDIAGHRACTPLLALCIASLCVPMALGGWVWPRVFGCMASVVAYFTRRRAAKLGRFATYHHVSFSFLVVTLLERATGLPFGAVVRARVGARLSLLGDDGGDADTADATRTGGTGAPNGAGVQLEGVCLTSSGMRSLGAGPRPCEFYLGQVPPHADGRIVRVEGPPCKPKAVRRTAAAAASGPREGGLGYGLLRSVVAPIEGWAIRSLFNARTWRRLLLPSSNGFFTARAVCRVFGALANGGAVRVCDGDGGAQWARLASEAAVADLAVRVADPARDVPGAHPDYGVLPADAPYPARESSGFFPWASPELHGEGAARRVLNSEGMGGSAAWADPATGLGVAVLKSSYEPLSALGGSISPDVVAIARAVRAALSLAEPGDEPGGGSDGCRAARQSRETMLGGGGGAPSHSRQDSRGAMLGSRVCSDAGAAPAAAPAAPLRAASEYQGASCEAAPRQHSA